MSVRAFAEALGETDSSARKWVYGQRCPTLQNAVAIERFTGGAVKATDFIPQTVTPSATSGTDNQK